MSKEYINRNSLISLLEENLSLKPNIAFILEQIIRILKECPAADVVEVKHGEWIPIPEYENKRCSVCSTVFSDFTLGYYCPRCGAKMDMKEEA